jgi:multidrug efflux pump subunit AcrB
MRRLPPGEGILSLFVRHRTLANLLLVILIVAGVAAGTRIRAQFFPDVVVQTVTVTVAWPGAGADDVDRAIVQVIEPALRVVDGVTRSTARAREGQATITLEFEPGHDIARGAEDVQAAVDTVRNLPEDAEDPVVRRGSWRDRVTDVVVSGPVGVDTLGRYADEFVGRLYDEGITRTTISGLAAPQIVVEVPTVALIRHNVTLREIANAIAAEVSSQPAGGVAGGAAQVRTGIERRSPEAIAGIVLRRGADGATLTLGEVATIREEGGDRAEASFVGDNPAILIRVDRADTGDAIRMQATVERVAAAMQATLPEGVRLSLIRTRAEEISDRLSLLIDNGLMGLGLVLMLLFLFLNARTAFWVAAGIPVAMAGAIAAMYLGGLTINMMSLFALIITLGIVVDDAIVVAEHADHRARQFGEAPVIAAENAARRMLSPVFASTVTTVLAFMAMFAISGRFGDLVAAIPFTVIAVLVASLIECFLILPNHMAHALAARDRRAWYDAPSRLVNRGFDWLRERAFRPFMRLVVRARHAVLALAVLALATQVAAILRGDVGWRFFNAPEQGSITGSFTMLPGATRDDTLAMMREVQRAVDAVAARYEAEHGVNPLTFVLGQIGGTPGRVMPGAAETKEVDQIGSVSIELIDPDRRPYSSFAFLADVQAEVRPHPRLEELSFRGFRAGPGGDALSVQMSAPDAQVLKDAAEALKAALAAFPQVSGLEDTLAFGKDEMILRLTPQGEALGFTAEGVARLVRERLTGIEAATYPDSLRTATIRVELPEAERAGDFLDRAVLRAPGGAMVPLADIVMVEVRSSFASVRRENGLRVVTVTGDVAEDDPAAAEAVQAALRETILPRLAEDYGVTWRLTGLAEQERDFLTDALTGLILCLIGIYLALAWIFASWTRPLVVMSVIPFGLVGAVWGHQVWGVPLSMFSVIGLIGMTGIIINDSIVLVGAIDEKAERRALFPTIIDGAADRLRAVILTTLTTVLGLAPLLYESSTQAQFLKPTVITLVYGLGFGMVLVLVVVPALMAVQADAGRAMRALRRGLRAGRVTLWAASLAVAAWFAATMGARIATGALPGPLAAAGDGMGTAFALFLAGTLAIVTVAALSAAVSGRGSRAVRPRAPRTAG